MHEAAIAKGIFDLAIGALPPGNRITKFSVVAGALNGVVKDSLALYLCELTRGTVAEGAILELKILPARLVCRACGESRDHSAGSPVETHCQSCGGLNRLDGKSQVYLESIEAELVTA